jgi:hypothetical protein
MHSYPTHWYPGEPDVPASDHAEGDSPLRYEDVSQDGRLMLLALPHTIGDVIWRKILAHHPLGKMQFGGIVPILTRFVLEGGSGPVGVGRPLHAEGRFQLAHTVDAAGAADRILLNMWTRASAPRGRTHGPPPEGAGEPVYVGRVFAEHVLTRLFAPPSERKVTALPDGSVPEPRWSWRGLDRVLALPEGAEPLDDLRPDPAEVVFGLNHTDSNQHVNSLVYPRLFQEAALRRFAACGKMTHLLARRVEVAYRKPCFAGARARILLRAFSIGDELGAVRASVSEQPRRERPHCVLQITFAA